ncbi:hypothetical protein [Frigoriglobus tundricola]|uniref:Uncharacterized protein n=1 Tax=Frigoriglobus tundricola TaxID=2774151 RepID=A0A6M5YWF3_9BACT|nr:hypothetical protein [Frigoriglobus tundricola]QJW97631.1 hypothetical protein FTUN_5206 [Frigoriglobus tundricola]
MVTRNRSDGSGSPHWWDDLPAQMRSRFSHPLALDPEPAAPERDERADDAPPPLDRGELISDLSRLAALFAVVAFGNVVFLLAALYFLCG